MRAELTQLVEAMERIHPNLFHDMGEDEWRTAVSGLDERIPELPEDELTVEFMRLVALPSYRGGRDGHMGAFPIDATAPPVFPFRWYVFVDGLYVTEAFPPYEELVGSRVTAIAGRPIEEVRAAVDALLPRDNASTPEMWLPRFLLMPEVLSGLGITEEPGPAELTFADPAGHERTLEIRPMPWSDYLGVHGPLGAFRLSQRPGAAWTARMDEAFWWEELADSGTIFVQYNFVSQPGSAVDEMIAAAEQPHVEQVVLDLRHNPGGNNHTYVPLIEALQGTAIDRPGRLFIITSQNTFSAAANLATEVDVTTDATFVGEPMGGGLNFYSDGGPTRLEQLPIPLLIPVSERYWEKAPGDDRLTIEPDIAIPMTAGDYFSGRDAALEAILSDAGS